MRGEPLAVEAAAAAEIVLPLLLQHAAGTLSFFSTITTFGTAADVTAAEWALEAFWDFELPEDIVSERGYPQLTEQAKRKILGGNLARLHGIDVDAKQAELGLS